MFLNMHLHARHSLAVKIFFFKNQVFFFFCLYVLVLVLHPFLFLSECDSFLRPPKKKKKMRLKLQTIIAKEEGGFELFGIVDQ